MEQIGHIDDLEYDQHLHIFYRMVHILCTKDRRLKRILRYILRYLYLPLILSHQLLLCMHKPLLTYKLYIAFSVLPIKIKLMAVGNTIHTHTTLQNIYTKHSFRQILCSPKERI